MSLPDEDFDVLQEDELALLTWRFERMHENQVNSRNSRACFKCGKIRHFFIECPKMNNPDKHKSKGKEKRSKEKEHEHRKKAWTREKIKISSDVDSGSEDASSSSNEEEEDNKRRKKKRRKNNRKKRTEKKRREKKRRKKKKILQQPLKDHKQDSEKLQLEGWTLRHGT
jgi:hypothetical protein